MISKMLLTSVSGVICPSGLLRMALRMLFSRFEDVLGSGCSSSVTSTRSGGLVVSVFL